MKKIQSSSEHRNIVRSGDSGVAAWYTNSYAILAFLIVLACQAYSAAMRGPFLFDDLTLPFASPLADNSPVAGWLGGVRPVLMLTYWMNYEVQASSTLGYHLTNVALHALNALLLYAICQGLFRLYLDDSKRILVASAFSSLLFLLHPLQTESVAYIAGRSEVLSATFVLGAWLIYVRRAGSDVTGRQSLAILFLFGLAAATKEQAVATVPVILLLTDWIVRRGSMWAELRANRRLYIPLSAGAAIGTVWVGTILLASRSAGASAGVSPLDYLLTQCRAILLYLRLFIFPTGQNADRDFPLSRNFLDHGAGLAALVILAGIFVLLRSRPLIRYGGLLFLAFLAPTSSIVPLADAFAERRMYLPIAALAIAVSATLAHLRFTTRRLAMACAVCSVVAFFATANRAEVWSNRVLFWQDVVAKSPQKARGYPHLTYAYVADGKCEDALRHLEQVKPILPRDYFIFMNWAQAHMCANQPDAAIDKLREAEKLFASADVYGLMGDILTKQGRLSEAELAYAKAVAKEPPGTDLMHVYLGNLALLSNDLASAQAEYLQALAVNPYSPEAVSQLRRLQTAASQQERSRSTTPAYTPAWPPQLPGRFIDRRMPWGG